VRGGWAAWSKHSKRQGGGGTGLGVLIHKGGTMDRRPGCLTGLLQLFLLDTLFDWLQSRFGFGSGGICGCGCGMILLFLFVIAFCSIITGVDWLQIGF
jgi:hypothetical protein